MVPMQNHIAKNAKSYYTVLCTIANTTCRKSPVVMQKVTGGMHKFIDNMHEVFDGMQEVLDSTACLKS